MSEVQIQIEIRRSMHCVSGDAHWSVDRDTVPVGVATRGYIDRQARIERKRGSKRKPLSGIESAHHVELVPAVVVGARPVSERGVTVARKVSDALRIVVGLAQDLLHLAGEVWNRTATKTDLQRIPFRIALGLHQSQLSKG